MTPKIKIEGPLKAGSLVYLIEGGKAFTTHKDKAAKGWPDPVGRLIPDSERSERHVPGLALKLNASAEGALSSLE